MSKVPAFPPGRSGSGRGLLNIVFQVDQVDDSELKTALRRDFNARRKALLAEERRDFDARIRGALLNLAEFREAPAVAAFVGFGAEPDLLPLFDGGKKLLLPRFNPEVNAYEMVAVNDLKRELTLGKYGILEPRPELRAADRDFVASEVLFLVPAVACDRDGVRLGRGGGYYDRLLKGATRPAAAVIYSCQLAERLPREKHDHPMGIVVTERSIIHISTQQGGK